MIFVIRIIIIVKNILIIVLEGTKARIYLCSYYIPWSHLCWRWWGPCFLDLLITVMTIVTYQSQFRWKSQSLTYITYQLKVCLVIQEMSSCPSKKQTLQIKNVQFHLFFMQLSNSLARGCWCLVEVTKLGLTNSLSLSLVEKLMFGWDFEVNA